MSRLFINYLASCLDADEKDVEKLKLKKTILSNVKKINTTFENEQELDYGTLTRLFDSAPLCLDKASATKLKSQFQELVKLYSPPPEEKQTSAFQFKLDQFVISLLKQCRNDILNYSNQVDEQLSNVLHISPKINSDIVKQALVSAYFHSLMMNISFQMQKEMNANNSTFLNSIIQTSAIINSSLHKKNDVDENFEKLTRLYSTQVADFVREYLSNGHSEARNDIFLKNFPDPAIETPLLKSTNKLGDNILKYIKNHYLAEVKNMIKEMPNTAQNHSPYLPEQSEYSGKLFNKDEDSKLKRIKHLHQLFETDKTEEIELSENFSRKKHSG
jgi:hypothetical protein